MLHFEPLETCAWAQIWVATTIPGHTTCYVWPMVDRKPFRRRVEYS